MAEYRKVYRYNGIEVTKSGGVRRGYANNSNIVSRVLDIPQYHNLTIKLDKNGNRIVRTQDYGNIRVDELVALAWLGNPKVSGQRHVIHKDGNKEHCWKDNLKWANTYEYGEFYKDDPSVNTPDGFRLFLDGIYVSPTGEVKDKGGDVPIRDYIYDSDTDRHVAVNPFFECEFVNGYGSRQRARFDLAETIAEAFLPTPANTNGTYFRLIHLDGSPYNCQADNLRWVSSGSDECNDYFAAREISIDNRNKELAIMFNGH